MKIQLHHRCAGISLIVALLVLGAVAAVGYYVWKSFQAGTAAAERVITPRTNHWAWQSAPHDYEQVQQQWQLLSTETLMTTPVRANVPTYVWSISTSRKADGPWQPVEIFVGSDEEVMTRVRQLLTEEVPKGAACGFFRFER